MLYKIHNPHAATQGIWASGARKFIAPEAGLILELTEYEAERAARRVVIEAVEQEPERIAHVEFNEVVPIEFREVEPDLNSLTDDELRAMAKSRSIKVHHKAGRAKLLEALN